MDVAPASVEAILNLSRVPLQPERFSLAVLEGRVVDVSAEDRGVDVWLTLLLEATNVSTAGAPFQVFSTLAIYDADGALIDAGTVAPGFSDLCPGATAQLEANYSVSLEGFDAGAASYELYFEDVEFTEEARCS